MSDPFLGEIRMFCGNYAPMYWALCDGSVLPITQNTALFSILGTTYGGDGRTTFALPDLRGRVPVHAGNGPGLSHYSVGQHGGQESVALQTSQMPAHTHLVNAQSALADQPVPTNNFPAQEVDSTGAGGAGFAAAANVTMNPNANAPAGGSQAHTNVQPYLCVNFIIALQGIYPSRS